MSEPKPSELRLARSLIDASVDGMLAFDRELRITAWNPAMEQITGLSAADVVGQNALVLLPYLVETGEDERLRRVLDGESLISSDRPYSIRGTNREGFYDAYYQPLYGAGESPIGGSAIIREITEMKLTTDLLRETEQRFKNMADISPVLLWMSGTDGLCTFFNQTWLDFTGRTMEQEWGVGWAEGVHFEDFQRAMDTYLEAFNARRIFEMEYRLRRFDGQYRWILDRGTPRYGPGGAFEGFIGSCIDITERKELESELRDAVAMRDEFLSIASHELRTPLTPLLLQLDRIALAIEQRPEEALASGRVARHLEVARRQTARLAQLVQGLLDVSRMREGRFTLQKKAGVDLAALAKSSIAQLGAAAENAGSEITLVAGAEVTGTWDPMRIEMIITNLISNAIKYGEGKPITVKVERDGHSAFVRVRDRGIGIAEADRMRIFDRFERAVSASHFGGLGLGLWISREIARGHGGTIRVESSPGNGSEFTVELPRGHES